MEFRYRLLQLCGFFFEVGPAEAGESSQLHVEDVVGLDLGEREGVRGQRLSGCGAVLAGSDGGDDLVDQVEAADQSFDYVQAFGGCVEAELGSSGNDFDLVLDVGGEGVAQVEGARRPADQCDHVDPEAGLQGCALPEVVEHDFGVGVAFE